MATLANPSNEYLQTIMTVGVYKPSQGQLMRYGTLAALGIIIAVGAYQWIDSVGNQYPVQKWAVPLSVTFVAGWIAFRTIHYPRFADFLIATEGEIAKVKWPTWPELRTSTGVIIANMIFMAIFLSLVDATWKFVLGSHEIWGWPIGLGLNRIAGLFGSGGQGM